MNINICQYLGEITLENHGHPVYYDIIFQDVQQLSNELGYLVIILTIIIINHNTKQDFERSEKCFNFTMM